MGEASGWNAWLGRSNLNAFSELGDLPAIMDQVQFVFCAARSEKAHVVMHLYKDGISVDIFVISDFD